MVDVGTIPARDRANGVVAGVAAGIARTLEVDPTLVRLLFALLTLAGGAGILLYLAAALLMPEAAGARTSGTRTAIGLALLLLAAIAALNGLGLPALRSGRPLPSRQPACSSSGADGSGWSGQCSWRAPPSSC